MEMWEGLKLSEAVVVMCRLSLCCGLALFDRSEIT